MTKNKSKCLPKDIAVPMLKVSTSSWSSLARRGRAVCLIRCRLGRYRRLSLARCSRHRGTLKGNPIRARVNMSFCYREAALGSQSGLRQSWPQQRYQQARDRAGSCSNSGSSSLEHDRPVQYSPFTTSRHFDPFHAQLSRGNLQMRFLQDEAGQAGNIRQDKRGQHMGFAEHKRFLSFPPSVSFFLRTPWASSAQQTGLQLAAASMD